MKQYLRQYSPKELWSISEYGIVPDVFQSLTEIFRISPSKLFSSVSFPVLSDYLQEWKQEQKKCEAIIDTTGYSLKMSEFEAIKKCLQFLPKDQRIHLHLSNGMSVRYANILQQYLSENIEVYANRGTSGIDGCTSTAFGHSLADPKIANILITGDISFFYDRNAFWHQTNQTNLITIVMNNNGGGIFGMIPAPKQQKEFNPYFTSPHALRARDLAMEYGIAYKAIKKRDDLEDVSLLLGSPRGQHIIEIMTKMEINEKVYSDLKKEIKKILK